jgi:Ni,Fe-hydrogenase III small subunit
MIEEKLTMAQMTIHVVWAALCTRWLVVATGGVTGVAGVVFVVVGVGVDGVGRWSWWGEMAASSKVVMVDVDVTWCSTFIMWCVEGGLKMTCE